MLDEALKLRIQRNRFVDRLRLDRQFDQGQFDALCVDLRTLADQWRDDMQIDKELAWDLIVQLTVARNSAEALSPDGDGPVWDAYIELDRLILEEVFYVPDSLRTWIPEPPA